eukprot:TCONS_00065511-protein
MASICQRWFALVLLLMTVAQAKQTICQGSNHLQQKFAYEPTLSFPSKNYPHLAISYDTTSKVSKILAPSSNSAWKIVPGLCGQGFSFESTTQPNHFLRHRNFLLFVDPFENTALYKNDACFKPVAGLADCNEVSFQSINYPDRFLRHQGYRMKLHPNDGSSLFKNDATFNIQTICQGSNILQQKFAYEPTLSFPSKNYPHLAISYDTTSKVSKILAPSSNSAWKIVPGLCGQGFSFESTTQPNHFLRHRNFLLFVDPFENIALYKNDACFKPVAGLADCNEVSFQSINYPDRFLRHQGYQMKLHQNDGSSLFKNDATFNIQTICQGSDHLQQKFAYEPTLSFPSKNYPNLAISYDTTSKVSKILAPSSNSAWKIVPGLCGQGFSFESTTQPNHFLRHRHLLLFVDPFENTALYKNDACFKPVAGLADCNEVSFQSINYPDRFLRHQGYRMKLHQNDGSSLFKNDATFNI